VCAPGSRSRSGTDWNRRRWLLDEPADLDDFEAFDEVYRQYFSEPYPTRVTVGCGLIPGLLIEIDAIFAVPDCAAGDGSPAK
jgi:hypothetical protein